MQRVYITTRTVGQSFGVCGQLRKYHPGCPDHGELVAETEVKPYDFVAPAMNAAVDLATSLNLLVVDEDYKP